MTTRQAGASLVLGIALWGLAGPARVDATQAPPAAAKAAPAGELAEVTGTYKGYAGKWANVWMEPGKRMRFEVDDRAVPDWRKRFHSGDRVTVSYRDFGGSRLPLAIGIKKAASVPPKPSR